MEESVKNKLLKNMIIAKMSFNLDREVTEEEAKYTMSTFETVLGALANSPETPVFDRLVFKKYHEIYKAANAAL